MAQRPVPLVRASALRPLLSYLNRSGLALPGQIALPEPLRREPTALVPLSWAGRFWEQACRITAADDLGLRVGAASRVDAFELGAFARASATVGAALAVAAQHGPRFNSGQRFWMVRQGDEMRLHVAFAPALRQGRAAVQDLLLMLLLDLIRTAAGSAWRPTEIRLEGAPPRHAEELAALAQGSTHFGQRSLGLVFPRRVLALALPPATRAPAPLHGLARSSTVPAQEFVGSVRQTIVSLLKLGRAELDVAAEAAGTSVRSFQRRLGQSGSSFAQLLEEARFATARRMLGDPGVRIIDVSAELGYTDSSNFTRAFRRWTGVSPQAFRSLAAQEPAILAGGG